MAHGGHLFGKVALVTGGARGIGAGIAERLAADGAHVIFTYASSASAADELVTKIHTAGGNAEAIAADSRDSEQLRDVLEGVVKRAGAIDIVVANAGGGTIKPLTDLDGTEIDTMIDVNIRGVVDVVRHSINHLGHGGRIITIGSVTAHYLADDASSIYGMTKGAVATFVQGMARELGPREITINNVQPGPIDTQANPSDGPAGDRLRSLIPVGRFGTVAEVASLVSYLAGSESAFINGASIDIDGGYSA
ncbi:SDR family oxidoreductase [Rhodococcus fascians]|nr:SDR family oxidoreductase [Rhodococcus fascians]MBY3998501.1 SDR family oxidoreductase [Rhodococcus fascians]MBY4004505.1 SDR family oxidoreductase [Rhodococcus fascians]MBY4009314.1 SDR family oxidoreductase [Rhodococcus fascians]MBY4019712.1 SDR family oxidoreductase [Rhodococcus fascians]